MSISIRINAPLDVESFRDLLVASTLGERRPIHDRACLAGMLANGNLMASAWEGEALVGIARCLTDFHYACYLSDLAVDARLQRQGLGRRLVEAVRGELGPRCKLILIAAPAADAWYERLGFERNPRCWTLAPDAMLRD